jgi:hypothetical protein
MAPPASSVMAMFQSGHPEQLPVSPAPAVTSPLPTAPDPPAQAPGSLATAPGDNRLRPLDVAVCSLCGIARPLGLLVPDGSPACTDTQWYCKDVRSCTERWTAARPR